MATTRAPSSAIKLPEPCCPSVDRSPTRSPEPQTRAGFALPVLHSSGLGSTFCRGVFFRHLSCVRSLRCQGSLRSNSGTRPPPSHQQTMGGDDPQRRRLQGTRERTSGQRRHLRDPTVHPFSERSINTPSVRVFGTWEESAAVNPEKNQAGAG